MFSNVPTPLVCSQFEKLRPDVQLRKDIAKMKLTKIPQGVVVVTEPSDNSSPTLPFHFTVLMKTAPLGDWIGLCRHKWLSLTPSQSYFFFLEDHTQPRMKDTFEDLLAYQTKVRQIHSKPDDGILYLFFTRESSFG